VGRSEDPGSYCWLTVSSQLPDPAFTARLIRFMPPYCRRPLARAARLADAKGHRQPPVPPARGTGFRTVADLAALMFAAAADPERPRAELDLAVGDMLAKASEFALFARRYRDVSDLDRQLDS
jgi:hypothetical protein